MKAVAAARATFEDMEAAAIETRYIQVTAVDTARSSVGRLAGCRGIRKLAVHIDVGKLDGGAACVAGIAEQGTISAVSHICCVKDRTSSD